MADIRAATGWKDYELLDASDGYRLERWGKTILQRPDPQVIWNTPKSIPQWKQVDAIYHRSKKGGGTWEYRKKLPEKWTINYKNLVLVVSPTGFKHTGVFPEQAANWAVYENAIKNAGRKINVLNLFGYTGGATLACAAAGASVTHVDASKGMVAWARENAQKSGLENKPIRWIVDDCAKFVQREIKRGNFYDAVIMDPPSYGRGPGGEIWKLEEAIWPLLQLVSGVLSATPLFFTLNSYTAGLAPGVGGYMLNCLLPGKFGGTVQSGEIGLKATASGAVLPCGSTGLWLE